MVSLTARIRRWFAAEDTLVECRDCGTTLDTDTESCPHCGSAEIGRYDLT